MAVYRKDSPTAVHAALQSILTQDFPDFRIFLGCDGPLPAPLETVIQSIEDERLCIIRFPQHRGLAACLNNLIDEALAIPTIDLFARMDADDISHRDRLRKQLAFMDNHERIDVLGSSCIEVDNSGKTLVTRQMAASHDQIVSQFVRRSPFVHPTVVFRRRVFEQGFRYPVDTHQSEDFLLWLNLLRNGFRFANLDEPLLSFRIDDNFYHRRANVKKGLSELQVRLKAVFALNLPRTRNLTLALAHFAAKCVPASGLRLLYRHLR